MSTAAMTRSAARRHRRQRGRVWRFKPDLIRHSKAAAAARDTGIHLPAVDGRAIHAWAIHGGIDAATIIERAFRPTIGGARAGVSRSQLQTYIDAIHSHMATICAGDDPRAAAVAEFLSVVTVRLFNHPDSQGARAALGGIMVKLLAHWPNPANSDLPRAARAAGRIGDALESGRFGSLPVGVRAMVRAATRCDIPSLAIWGALDLHALGLSDRTLRNWMRADRRIAGSRHYRRFDSEDPAAIAGLLCRYLHDAGDDLARRVRLALAARFGIAVDREGVVCP